MRLVVDFLGVLTEVGMLYYLYENILVRKNKPVWQVAAIYVCMGVMFLLISTYIDQPRMRTLFYSAMTLVPLVFYQSKWPIRILTAMMYCAAQAVVEMAVKAALLSIFGNTAELPYELGVLVAKGLAVFVVYLMVSLFRVQAHTLSLRLFSALLILPIASMIIIYQLIDISYLLNTQSAYVRLIVVSVLLVGANVAMCYLFGRMTEMDEIRRRDALAQVQLELQQKQYDQLAVHQQEVRRMYHDLKRSLQVIGEYLKVGQTAKAISFIQQQEVAISQQQLTITGCGLLDGVLAAKKELAQQQNIQWNCQAYLSERLTLPETDLAIILDNGLDNAIEAAAQLADSEKRWLNIVLKQQRNILYMTISNSAKCPQAVRQGEKPQTTKTDVANHGLGMTNMQLLTQKHNGDMTYSCDEGAFVLQIIIDLAVGGNFQAAAIER